MHDLFKIRVPSLRRRQHGLDNTPTGEPIITEALKKNRERPARHMRYVPEENLPSRKLKYFEAIKNRKRSLPNNLGGATGFVAKRHVFPAVPLLPLNALFVSYCPKELLPWLNLV